MRNENFDKYVIDQAETINHLDGYELNNAIIDLIEVIAKEDHLGAEENIIDISDSKSKLEVLSAIYDNIKSDDDKLLFAQAIVENESKLGNKITDEFKDKAKDPKQNNEEPENQSPENDEEEKEKDDNNLNPPAQDGDNSSPAENDDKPEEDKTQEQEGPAITQYKKETEELEKNLSSLEEEYQKLLEQLEQMEKNKPKANPTKLKEEYETLKKKIELAELNPEDMMYPEFEADKRRLEELKEQIENLSENKAAKLKEEYETLKKKVEAVELNPEDMMYPEFEADKRKLEELKEQIENLPENKAAKLQEEYETLKKKIELVELNPEDMMYPEFEADKRRLEELKQEIENLSENKTTKLQEEYETLKKKIELAELNPEDMMYPEFEADKRRLEELKEQIEQSETIGQPTEEEAMLRANIDELSKLISKSKEELTNRKSNIAIYYNALNDIKEIGKDVQAGKDPESEEMKNRIEAVKSKIAPLPDSLKQELEQYLEKALTRKIGGVTKDPNKRKRWLSGIAGFALGAGLIAFTPLGLGGAFAIAAGSQVLKRIANKLHQKYKEEAKELGPENVVTNIEKPTGKLAQLKEKFKEKMRDENFVRNLSWFLNGASIGALTAGTIEQIASMVNTATPAQGTPTTEQPVTGAEQLEVAGTPAPTTDPYSNIAIGNNAEGLNLAQGYDQANWAVNGTNVESLNQQLVNGESIIQKFGIVGDNGVVQTISNPGTTIQDLINQGIDPERISVLVGKNGIGQAWTNLGDLTQTVSSVGRTL